MNVTFKVSALMVLILLNGSALAGSWVIGTSLSAISGSDDNSLNNQLASSGLNATATTDDSIRIVWQLYGGYDFTARWGAELSYLDLGKVETTFTGTSVDIETFLTSAEDIHPQTAQGWLISMVHYFPIDSSTRVKARLGMYDWEADYTLEGGNAKKSVTQNGSDISFGIGMEMGAWRRKNQWIGHLKWDRYSVEQKDFSVIGVGFSFRFE